MPRKLILDVDTGTDDAIAVLMAAMAPELELLGCSTVWGNSDVEVTTENTLRVLAAISRSDIPVHSGLGKPYAPDPYPTAHESAVSHGRYGILDLGESPVSHADKTAVEWIVETLRATTDPVTLVPVAPLTNIAAAVTVAPEIVDAVEEVVIMGGGHAAANMSPNAEANIWHDPVAASVVVHAGFRRIVLVPLDATHETAVTMGDIAPLVAVGTEAARITAAMIDLRVNGHYAKLNPLGNELSAPLNDAVCIAYLLDKNVLDVEPCHLDVERTSLLTWGRTVVDLRRGPRALAPNAHIALHADRRRFLKVLQSSLAGSCSSAEKGISVG